MASTVLTDAQWITRGAERVSLPRFLAWLSPWAVLLGVGIYAAALCLFYGLNQTNMDNRFAFGLWIFLDLGIIALGAGAFFTGFLVYILKRVELKPILNTAVVVGFSGSTPSAAAWARASRSTSAGANRLSFNSDAQS